MIPKQYRFILLLAIPVFVAQAAVAQRQLLPQLPITLSGSLAAGYAGGSGAATTAESTTSNSLTLGGMADLAGSYYDPRFLQFDINPRYTWSHDGSNVANALQQRNDGVAANVDFLQGSATPIHFNYNLTQTNSATLSGGTTPFTVSGGGLAQSISVSTATHFRKLPSISVSYSQTASNTSISGVSAPEESMNNNLLNVYSGYKALGFVLSGNYSHSTSHSETQDLLNLGIPTAPSETSSDAETFTLIHNIPLHGSASASYGHNTDSYSAGGAPQNDSFDTATASIAMLPVPRLSWNADANYTSNASNELISEAVSGQTTSSTVLGTGRTFTVETNATYQMGRVMSVGGSGAHVTSQIAGESLDSNLGAGILTYAFNVWHGFLLLSYAPGWDSLTITEAGQSDVSSGLDNTATASYQHQLGGWVVHGNVSFAENNAYENATVPQAASSFSANGSARTRFRYYWDFTTTGTVTKNQVIGSNGTLSELLSAQISNRKWSVNGQFQRSSGYSLFAEDTTVSGVTSSGTQTLFNDSQSYSLSGNYHHKLFSTQLSYSYTNGTYDTSIMPTTTSNSYLEARVYYKVRKLDLQAGYRRITQAASSNQSLDSASSGYWINIVRQFRAF